MNEAALIARITKRFNEQGRADDNPDAFKVRLKAYSDQTAPLVPYYQGQGKMTGLDGMADIDAVSAAVAAAIDGAARKR